MKTFTYATITIMALSSVGNCQTTVVMDGGVKPQGHQTLSARELTTAMIRNLISSSALLKLDNPKLRRMGDGAAAEVLNIMKTRGSLTPAEQQNVVQIVHKAFENPAAIMQAADRRTPQASLALLEQVNASTKDFALKLQISDTRQFVLDSSSK